MNQEDIICMAREAGWSGLYTTYNEPTGEADWKMVKESLTVPVTMEQIERFAALVFAAGADAEREACANLADAELLNTASLMSYPPKSSAAWNIGAAIRARSKQ